MAIDPCAAAMDALVAHLGAVSGVGTARRGWPEQSAKLDFSAGPLVSVSMIGTPTLEWESPVPLEEGAVVDGELEVTWRLGLATFEVSVDLWAPYRKTRDDLAEPMVRAFHPNVPFDIGLELACPNYYDQIASIEVGAHQPADDTIAASAGEWRQQWVARIAIGLVARATHPAQAEIVLRTTIQLGSSSSAEPDLTLPDP